MPLRVDDLPLGRAEEEPGPGKDEEQREHEQHLNPPSEAPSVAETVIVDLGTGVEYGELDCQVAAVVGAADQGLDLATEEVKVPAENLSLKDKVSKTS